MLFIDLDDFKIVNDTLGHAAGDALLVAVTERIADLVRASDLVARLGGDEFAILTDDDAGPQAQPRDGRAPRPRAARAVPHRRPTTSSVTASIGIASARDAVDGAADLVRNADVAMYMAKANGKSGFAIFDPGMHAAIRERHELGAELQRAVELDQLRLVYQPIVELETGDLAGVEALVRWQHPERGLILPGQFIEIAEENGAILPIGRWVLREACRSDGRRRREGRTPPGMFVCVNVSAREIQQPGFVEQVRAIARRCRPGRRRARSSRSPRPRSSGRRRRRSRRSASCAQLGVRIVIDDFGTGYFSLSHLRQFPVDVLKIASEFVRRGRATRAVALVGAGRRDRRAEPLAGDRDGRRGHRDRRAGGADARLGCPYGQGYFFGRPMTVDQFVVAAGAGIQTVGAADGTRRPAAVGRSARRSRIARRTATGFGAAPA